MPATAADLAEAIRTATTALPGVGAAPLVPFCTLALDGAAWPLLLTHVPGTDGRLQTQTLLLDSSLQPRARLDHGDGAPQRCSGARLVLRGSAHADDGRDFDAAVLRLGADGRFTAEDTDPNTVPITPPEPPATGRAAAALQSARAAVAATLRRAGVVPKGQTLAGWQPVCVLEAGNVRVPVLGWLALALPKVGPGDYVPPARGSGGLLLTDANGAPLVQLDAPVSGVLGCDGATLRLAEALYASDCRARGWHCSGSDGNRLELAPQSRTLTLRRDAR